MTTNPVKAIREKCLDCMCGNSNEVKICPCADCALHPFRFGRNPYRQKREYTEEEREKMAERMRSLNAQKHDNLLGIKRI